MDETEFTSEEKKMNSGTDRTNGEYHYKNGQTEKIYTDANYTSANDDNIPPRYYTPPVRPASSRRVRKKASPTLKVSVLCLACAIIGGICGAGAVLVSLKPQINMLEERVGSIPVVTTAEPVAASTVSAQSGYSSGSDMALSDIYELACSQTVGITSDITYSNFFGMRSSTAVSGSGFVITANGYIMTNYHVIEAANSSGSCIQVMFYDGGTYTAEVVGFDESNDIAVLKIDAEGLSPVSFANSNLINVGDEAYAVGNPLGELEFTMTFGRISALDRVISTENSNAINMFQLDAAVNSGNSGGPVYNSDGQVSGIVTAKYNKSGVEGLGFAIPANDAVKIANDLITKGYVTGKAFLGITPDERYTALVSQYYGMPRGTYVYSVKSGSCSEAAGILPGDVIVAIDDTTVRNASELRSCVKGYHSGDSVEVTVYRESEYIKLSVVFDEITTSGETGI